MVDVIMNRFILIIHHGVGSSAIRLSASSIKLIRPKLPCLKVVWATPTTAAAPAPVSTIVRGHCAQCCLRLLSTAFGGRSYCMKFGGERKKEEEEDDEHKCIREEHNTSPPPIWYTHTHVHRELL